MAGKTVPQYDVVISFAGEDRAIAAKIANSLIDRGITVFYDAYEEVNLWGKDLYRHLSTIYRDNGKYCLMIISASYARKQWTNHEKRAAQARAFRENQEYILPLRLDNTEIEGLEETVGYISFQGRSIEDIVELVCKKINGYNQIHEVKSKASFNDDLENGDFLMRLLFVQKAPASFHSVDQAEKYLHDLRSLADFMREHQEEALRYKAVVPFVGTYNSLVEAQKMLYENQMSAEEAGAVFSNINTTLKKNLEDVIVEIVTPKIWASRPGERAKAARLLGEIGSPQPLLLVLLGLLSRILVTRLGWLRCLL
jgi:hypothetical protein